MIHPKLERACAYYCGELRNTHKKQRRYLSHDGKAKPFWGHMKKRVYSLLQ